MSRRRGCPAIPNHSYGLRDSLPFLIHHLSISTYLDHGCYKLGLPATTVMSTWKRRHSMALTPLDGVQCIEYAKSAMG